jgi:hypothetical protein
MKYKIESNGHNLSVTFTASSKPELSGFKEFLDEIIKSPDYSAVTKVLLDFSDIHLGKLNSYEIRRFIDAQRYSFRKIEELRVAVVVARPIDFGVVRICGALAEDFIPGYQVFYTSAEALKWLNREKPGDSALNRFLSVVAMM